MEETEKFTEYSNTPMTPTLLERLTRLTYINMFGTNRSAYIRSLIEKAWSEHQAEKQPDKPD